MRPKRFRSGVVWMVVLFMLLIWPSIQVYNFLSPKIEASDPLKMLYEVVQFQMNLLKGSMQEAKRVHTTDQLQKLKLVAYSAAFAHERLVRAVGKDKLPELSSMNKVVEMITLLQLNGDRPLADSEKEVISTFADAANKLVDSYALIYNSSGHWIASQRKELILADKELISVLDSYFAPQ
ncbi:S-adenosylmethionine decarboxylase [Paenibacillus alvei]|uniref:S-adenosylmethionine decarboxylase n=1 Tax=Paenibacillus alvei TaxID=44250 RepID=UPI0013DA7813|nr:S-adenosylmethionine decarboxylase [Paenibacillus alvei]MBG9734527.1 S-adenosylmethionine decarboxylase [Paenibacillus alvei]MBG9743162.1 S-adenosylmethionine decarboxylase [Paenibacillus alvei]MCY9579525.1 S-adenosylmethionine decarboxylase [Paenibacillus alvei]MCY9586484.1 S-adenosylmethionine decarboxylase [Paenibacillus alvei]NEZ43836.1 S-adenosylmethionine decarboxylase [Paenibacillus alvei]